MSITEKTTTVGKHPCGFCSVGTPRRHDLCPGGILNGNKTSVYVCPCNCDTPKLKCLECGVREDVNPATWSCNDPDACAQRLERRRAEFSQTLVGKLTDPNRPKNPDAPEKVAKAPAKPKTGTCLCCGETTGGGLFRPGHDSKYLTAAVAIIRDGQISLDDTLTKWAREGISPALQGKLTKRASA